MIADIVRKVKRLLIYVRPARWQALLAVACSAIDVIVLTWLLADLMGNTAQAVQDGEMAGLWRTVLYALPWMALWLCFRMLYTWLSGSAAAKATNHMRERLFASMIRMPLGQEQETHTGFKLSYFTNDIPTAMGVLIKTLAEPVDMLCLGVVGMMFVLRTHPLIALVAVGLGAFSFLYSILFAKWLHGIAVKRQQAMAELETRLKDTLDGMLVIRMYGMREKLEGWMHQAAEWLRKTGVRWAWASGLLGGFNNATYTLSERLLIFTAGLVLLSGALGLPELMRVTEMAGAVVGLFGFSRTLISIQQSLAGAERVFAQLDAANAEPDGSLIADDPGETVIAMRDVSFSYGQRRVLENLNLEVRRGEWAVLIGPSGSGKSTILRLLQGLYQPDGGQLEVLGVPVSQWDLQALRQQVALVPQEPVLFPGSIADNIAIGQGELDEQRMIRAAMDAGAHEFISAFPDGYDTQVAERGGSLSGGQRQRIAIARALYRDASILLLDEITSALDSESEARIIETLAKLKGERTLLSVTHRTAALKHADRVVRIS